MDGIAQEMLLKKLSEITDELKDLRRQQAASQNEQRLESLQIREALAELRVQMTSQAAEIRTLHRDVVRLNAEAEANREELIEELTTLGGRVETEAGKRAELAGELKAEARNRGALSGGAGGTVAAGVVTAIAELIRRLIT